MSERYDDLLRYGHELVDNDLTSGTAWPWVLAQLEANVWARYDQPTDTVKES